MKNSGIQIIIIVVAFLGLLYVANTFLCSQTGSPPEIVDIRDIRITGLNRDSVNLQVGVIAKNKNESDIKVNHLHLNLLIGSDTLGAVVQDKNTFLKRLDTAYVNFIGYLSTVKLIKLLSADNNIVTLRVLGTGEADPGFISLPVNVDLSYSFNVKEKLAETVVRDIREKNLIDLQNATLKLQGINSSAVEIKIKVNNIYGLDFIVKDYPSEIFVNGSKAGTGNIKGEISISGNGTDSYGIAVYRLNNLRTITSLIGSLGGKLAYETKGTLYLEILDHEINFPFNFGGE
jgi:hypothetical protein